MVYTAAAGVHPEQLLPISVDVGCNVDTVRNHPLYMGLQQVKLLFAEVRCNALLHATCNQQSQVDAHVSRGQIVSILTILNHYSLQALAFA